MTRCRHGRRRLNGTNSASDILRPNSEKFVKLPCALPACLAVAHCRAARRPTSFSAAFMSTTSSYLPTRAGSKRVPMCSSAIAAAGSAARRCSPMSSSRSTRPATTSYAAVGLSAKFGDKIYIRPGLGLAIHTGSADNYYRTDKIAFGSRILFEPELAVGTRINDRLSVEASWVHMSHAHSVQPRKPRDRQSRRSAEPGALAADHLLRLHHPVEASPHRPAQAPARPPSASGPSCARAWRSPPHCRSRSRARAR